MNESEFLRQLVLDAISRKEDKEEFINTNDSLGKKVVSIRLPEILLNAANKKAQYKGMTLNRWVISLIQSSVTGNPVLSEAEFIALKESNRNLLAIGRNLNQITKAVNEVRNMDKLKMDLLQGISKSIDNNWFLIGEFLKASHNAWGFKDE